jgi:hypothetical protein
VIKSRVAEPGSLDFGPETVVRSEGKAIPFGGLLQGNTFRAATYPKNTVKLVNGEPRFFVTWDRCSERMLDAPGLTVCNKPVIKLAWSDDFGASWKTKTLSNGGVNYFPTIAIDSSNGNIVVAWYTHRFDAQYQNAQDVEMVTVDATSVNVTRRQRVTSDPGMPNETEADPLLNAFFIGDYFEVIAHNGQAYVHYNMNIHDVALFDFVSGEFATIKTPQQDNFLTRLRT